MHPKDSISSLFNNVHFVVRTEIRGLLPALDAYATLLPIGRNIEGLRALRKFVLERGIQTFVQMVVLRVARQIRRLLSLVQNLTDEDTVHSDAPLSSKIHNARICVTFLKEKMLVELVHEVDFDWFHTFFNTFQN